VTPTPAPPEFVALLLQARRPLRSFALRMTGGNATAAEDLVSTGAEKALRYWSSFRPGTNFTAWVFRIVRNEFLTRNRNAWRSVEMGEGQAEAVPAPDNPFVRIELNDVMARIARLPPDMREALMLVAEGEEYEDAAALLGVPVGTVKSRVCRARKTLRHWLGETRT
jgi:RNA polymerase sigma-70 factor (ECF subfamily)